jgi:hypothetical protein
MPDNVTIEQPTASFLESEPPLLAFSSPQFAEKIMTERAPDVNNGTVTIDSVYFDAEVTAQPFFCDKPSFPSIVGKLSTRDVMMNPPTGIFFVAHPDFEAQELLTRFTALLNQDCQVTS